MYASAIRDFLKEFYANLKKLKHLLDCEFIYEHSTSFTYDCKGYFIKTSYDVEHDEDCYMINIYFDIDQFPDKFNIKEFCFDPRDGKMLIGYKNDTDLAIDDYKNITEELLFQQSLIYDLKNTDVQYWKDCAKLMDRISKVEN